VTPAVAGLRKQGANRGACLAFLISTPETGVDSIAITYSLFDPIMTLIRPFSAFVTSFSAGLIDNFTSRIQERTSPIQSATVEFESSENVSSGVTRPSIFDRLADGLRFGFGEILGDLAGWFTVGIFIAGCISALVPESFFGGILGSGLFAYLGMLVVSLPMYVCATVTTPIAAAMVAKGLSPGAALVFLLAGPATNAATITMVAAMLGRRSLIIYLSCIIFFSIVMAFVTDAVYSGFGIPVTAAPTSSLEYPLWQTVEILASLVLAILLVSAIFRQLIQKVYAKSDIKKTEQVVKQSEACCPKTSGSA
jgi:uncharacterized protein